MLSSSGDSTIGNASIASRPARHAASLVNPCSTSWTTGRHVTISSKSIRSSRTRRGGRWNTSIQAEVSTRTTAPLAVRRAVLADDRQVAFPGARARQVEDPARLRPADEVLHRALDRARIRALLADLQRFLEKGSVEHKICALHVYMMPRPTG